MELKEAKQKLGLSQQTIDEVYVNPLRIIASDEFNKPSVAGKNYRRSAIDRVLSLDVSFSSDCNTFFELAQRFIKIVNPKTGNEMVCSGGSGSANSNTIRFVDPITKDEFSVTCPDEGLNFKVR